jgi:glycosyltransferase involved in cell wall biosynthesis
MLKERDVELSALQRFGLPSETHDPRSLERTFREQEETIGLGSQPKAAEAADKPRGTVAVIIPLYNGAAYIAEALRSVLGQTRPPDEVIVVDDGSTDDGAEIVANFPTELPITLLRKENGGQSSARNFGVRHAKTALIAFLDQDDTWYPSHLQKLEEPFLQPRFPPLGWVYSNLDEVDESGAVVNRRFLDLMTAEHPKTKLDSLIDRNQYVLPSASLILRSAFDSVGGFDESLSGFEDDDLFIRVFRAGYQHVYIDTPLSSWRIHQMSSSYSIRMAQSRMKFAAKLLLAFPDEEDRHRRYSRDSIAPRFLHDLVDELGPVAKKHNRNALEHNIKDIRWLLPHLRASRRGKLRIGLLLAHLAIRGRAYKLSAKLLRKASKW